ncbi:MAG: 2OG-Fe(II) oxygenase family protein [Pseudomonadota bacterium]
MDIDDLVSGDDRASVAYGIEATLMDSGYLMLSGSRLRCIRDALARWEGFTALPIETRQSFHHSVRDGEAAGGWSLMREHAVYTSHMRDAEMESREPKQEYGFSVETERTLWPDEQVLPGFAADVAAAAGLCDRVARSLLGALESVLDREPGFLRYEPGYVALKHYPGQPASEGGAHDAGLDEHSDAVVFTMLAQSRESLQIKRRDGSWFTVPADPGASLLVIPGDWMELFTNGRIPAVRHRVMDTEASRTSLAFFQNVAPMTVGPLDKFVDDANPPAYPSVSSDIDYVGGESGVPRWQTA